MKYFGWILIVLSILASITSVMVGRNVVGTLFWGVLGAYLISRANKKEKEKSDKDKWTNGN